MTPTAQVDPSQLGIALLLAQAGASALVATALVALFRSRRRPFLLHWAGSWAALTLSTAAWILAAYRTGATDEVLAALALSAGFLHVVLLLSGAWLLVQGVERTRIPGALLVAVPVLLGCGGVFATLGADPGTQVLGRTTLPAAVNAAAFLAAAVGVARVARADSTTSRWFVVLLFALDGALELAVALVGARPGGFVDPLALLFAPNLLALFLQLLLIASLVLWFFEDERRALERTTLLLRRSEEQRRRSEHMEAVGRLAGGVAHDFNNLLTAITGHAELLLGRAREGHPDRDDLLPIARAARRAADLVRGLLTFSGRLPTRPRAFSLDALLADMRRMLARLAGENVRFELDLGAGDVVVNADPGEIELALINLASNARDAIAGQGRLTFRTSLEEIGEDHATLLPPGSYLRLDVADTGCGIPADRLDKIFEPFFTTKPGKGTGLGLSSVYGIVKESGGEIQVRSTPGEGTVFQLWFPLHAGPAEAQVEIDPRAPRLGGREALLLVEDDADVRLLTQRQLTMAGYRVLTAEDAEHAVQKLAEAGEGIDLVLSDVVMPGRPLRELLDEITEHHPRLRVLLMSGYSGAAIQQRGIELSGVRFLAKPFGAQTLLEKVRETLDAPLPERMGAGLEL